MAISDVNYTIPCPQPCCASSANEVYPKIVYDTKTGTTYMYATADSFRNSLNGLSINVPPPIQKLDLTKVFPDSELAVLLSEQKPKGVENRPVLNGTSLNHKIRYEIEIELTDEEFQLANAQNTPKTVRKSSRKRSGNPFK